MKDLWDRQKFFEAKFFDSINLDVNKMTLEQKRIWSKEYFNHIIVELASALDKIKYKMHRDNDVDDMDIYNIKEEIIDSYKLILSFAQLWFDDEEDFYDVFNEKSTVVESRFEFEKLNKIADASSKVIIVDIDGVLADWEQGFSKFIFDYCNCNAEVCRTCLPWLESESRKTDIIKKIDLKVYDELKRAYRISGEKRNMPVYNGASQFTKKLSKLGFKVVIITARPYSEFSRIWYDTKYWLQINNIYHDALFFDDKKHKRILKTFKDRIESIKYVIDDNQAIISDMENLNLKCFKIDHDTITFDSILKQIKQETKNK
jgi:hypothetical protein